MDPNDELLVDRLQCASFGYFDAATNPENGLVADNTSSGAPASIAAVGFGLTALPVGVQRGWIDRQAALQRALAAARFFQREQTSRASDAIAEHGFFYHFLDMRDGRRAWTSEVSAIDTAILLHGLLTASAFFDGGEALERELGERTRAVLAAVDWSWLIDRNGSVRMGWSPETGMLRSRWRGLSEVPLLFVLALGSSDDPRVRRAYVKWLETLEWLGSKADGYVHAGPLFVHLFPHAWLDLQTVRVGNHGLTYRENAQRAIAAQRHYAQQNPGPFAGYSNDIWGLSACPGPGRRCTLSDGRRIFLRDYRARAVPYGPDDGTLVPWAAIACLPLDAEASISGYNAILRHYPNVLQDGRLVDAFNPSVSLRGCRGWYSSRSTGLDQGLVVAMTENARSGLIWNLTSKQGAIQRGLRLMNDLSANELTE